MLFVFEVINHLYIILLVVTCIYAFCKPQIEYLYKQITDINKKQNILYQSILKLKSIINIDNSFSTEQFDELKKKIDSIKRVINDTDSEEEDSVNILKNNLVLPIQNHITFPKLFIFNEKNFKQTKLSNNDYEFRFIGKDLRLISNELVKFLKVKSGTCMEFDDVCVPVFNYIQDNEITNIGEDCRLRNLFGINENEDYEYSTTNIIRALKKMLEPHCKKVVYEYYY